MTVSQNNKKVDPHVDHLARRVVADYKAVMKGDKERFFGEPVCRAFVSQAVMDVMTAQDNQDLPISRFTEVYECALGRLGL